MDTLIVIIACLYVLFESFTALESMPKVSVLRFFHEFANPYALKYWGCGFYALFALYHADDLQGWLVLLIFPPVYWVSGRLIYRMQHFKWHRHS